MLHVIILLFFINQPIISSKCGVVDQLPSSFLKFPFHLWISPLTFWTTGTWLVHCFWTRYMRLVVQTVSRGVDQRCHHDANVHNSCRRPCILKPTSQATIVFVRGGGFLVATMKRMAFQGLLCRMLRCILQLLCFIDVLHGQTHTQKLLKFYRLTNNRVNYVKTVSRDW